MQSGEKITKKRDPALDLVRIFALITVISVHFFGHTDWYYQEVSGIKMWLLTTLRQFFMICVPLFMVLTGFLMSRKELCRDYYKKIGHTISMYILASLTCSLYRNLFTPNSQGLYNTISGFFSYKAAPYGWYIEMYIGLFLLIPFLNLIWRNLKNRRQHLALIGTFILLVALPAIFNAVDFRGLFLGTKALGTDDSLQLLPDYWSNLYPFMYYFIGCFLREYKPKLKAKISLIGIIITALIDGTFVFLVFHHQEFMSNSYDGHQSIFVVVLTVLVFLFFTNLNYSKVPARISRFLAYLSSLCLGAYLVSWIFDDIFYPTVLENPHVLNRFYMMPIIVLEVAISSLFLSAILNQILKILTNISNLCHKKIRAHIQHNHPRRLIVATTLYRLNQDNDF